jgi:hypothetical protein
LGLGVGAAPTQAIVVPRNQETGALDNAYEGLRRVFSANVRLHSRRHSSPSDLRTETASSAAVAGAAASLEAVLDRTVGFADGAGHGRLEVGRQGSFHGGARLGAPIAGAGTACAQMAAEAATA